MRSTMRQLLGGKKSHKTTVDDCGETRANGPERALSTGGYNTANGMDNGMAPYVNRNQMKLETGNSMGNTKTDSGIGSGVNDGGYSNTTMGNGFRNNLGVAVSNGPGNGIENSLNNSMIKGSNMHPSLASDHGNTPINSNEARNNRLGTGQESSMSYYSHDSHEASDVPNSLSRGLVSNNMNSSSLSAPNASNSRYDKPMNHAKSPRSNPSRVSAITGSSFTPPRSNVPRNETRRITERIQYISETPSSKPLVSAGIASDSIVAQLLKCEDEPIRIPGAVQSHGALICLRYNEKDDLEVRIASENSRKILGYGPEQLFALGSFLDILEEPSRTEMIIHLNHCLQKTPNSQPREVYPSFFHITLKFPYEPDCRLWCTIHLEPNSEDLIICEFEGYSENYYLKDVNATKSLPQVPHGGLDTDIDPDDYEKSITIVSKPIAPLEIAQKRSDKMFSSLDIFCCLSRIQNQIIQCQSIKEIEDVLVGLVSDVTGFHRVMCYRFDSEYNGCVEAELVNPNASSDIFRGLHYPASDIPVQARELYKINRIRILFERDAETSRLVVRDDVDSTVPLDLTHAYLRAMSPIHHKYLENMGVSSSLSISLVIDDILWGLISCHGYGVHGIRISLPMRELCRSIGDFASTNIQKLLALERIRARRLPPSFPSSSTPPSSDLLALVDADFAVLNIGNKVRAIGRMEPFHEATLIINYLQSCRVNRISSSQNIKADYPELGQPKEISTLAGMLIIPLNIGKENDFLVFFRRGQLRNVHWAGNPREKIFKSTSDYLQPRASFQRYVETVYDTCKAWTEDQLDTASILALLYGRFAETWRMKASASQTKEIDNDHDKDPSSAPVDDTFNLKAAATRVLEALKKEAQRKALDLTVSIHEDIPTTVIGDADCFKQVMLYFIRNGFRASQSLKVDVNLIRVQEETCYVELKIQDAGPGMTEEELDDTFQEFERAQSNEKWPFPNQGSPPNTNDSNRGSVTLSVVATFVRSINGQIQVTSEIGKGTIFTVELPYKCTQRTDSSTLQRPRNYMLTSHPPLKENQITQQTFINTNIDSNERRSRHEISTPVISAFPQSPASPNANENLTRPSSKSVKQFHGQPRNGAFENGDANKIQTLNPYDANGYKQDGTVRLHRNEKSINILVSDNDVSSLRMIESRLVKAGYSVDTALDGQECHDRFALNPNNIDLILMEINMPLVDGILSTRMIRIAEKEARHRNGSESSQTRRQRVPIIAFSSTLEEENRFDYIQSGFDGWLLKPIDFRRLELMIQGLADPKQRQGTLYVPGHLTEGGWFLP